MEVNNNNLTKYRLLRKAYKEAKNINHLYCYEPYYQIINYKKVPLSLQTWCWKVIDTNELDTTCLPKWLKH